MECRTAVTNKKGIHITITILNESKPTNQEKPIRNFFIKSPSQDRILAIKYMDSRILIITERGHLKLINAKVETDFLIHQNMILNEVVTAMMPNNSNNIYCMDKEGRLFKIFLNQDQLLSPPELSSSSSSSDETENYAQENDAKNYSRNFNFPSQSLQIKKSKEAVTG